MRNKALFSPEHVAGKKEKKKAAKKESKPVDVEVVPIVTPPSLALDETARRALRARQLLAATSDPGYVSELRQDGVNPPQRNENQLGPTVAPEVNPHYYGTGPGEKNLSTLPDEDIDVHRDRDLRLSSVDEELQRFAALSAFDQQLQSFDNKLTDTFSTVRVLKMAAQQLQSRVLSENDMELNKVVAEIVSILDSAVEPWLLEVETYFNSLADKTVERQAE